MSALDKQSARAAPHAPSHAHTGAHSPIGEHTRNHTAPHSRAPANTHVEALLKHWAAGGGVMRHTRQRNAPRATRKAWFRERGHTFARHKPRTNCRRANEEATLRKNANDVSAIHTHCPSSRQPPMPAYKVLCQPDKTSPPMPDTSSRPPLKLHTVLLTRPILAHRCGSMATDLTASRRSGVAS